MYIRNFPTHKAIKKPCVGNHFLDSFISPNPRVGSLSHLDDEPDDELRPEDLQNVPYSKMGGFQLWRTRFRALLTKRVIYTKRRFALYFIMACVPVLFAFLTQLQVIWLYLRFPIG